MNKALFIFFLLGFFGCSLISEKGNSVYQSEKIEIRYSFDRNLTGFQDFPTQRWFEITNKQTGVKKKYRFHEDIIGDAEIHVYVDSLFETVNGDVINVISFRDSWGVLDLERESLERVNEEYIMNKYFGKIGKVAIIKNDTFALDKENKILGRYPIIEFNGCSRFNMKETKFRELDILIKKELENEEIAVVLEVNDSLKVLTLSKGKIQLQNLSRWRNHKELEVWEYKSKYDMICNRELERIKYEVNKLIGRLYNPRRLLKNRENLDAEFINEVFLYGRINFVDDIRLDEERPIDILELKKSKISKLVVDLNKRKNN